jgi:hypothetical protein
MKITSLSLGLLLSLSAIAQDKPLVCSIMGASHASTYTLSADHKLTIDHASAWEDETKTLVERPVSVKKGKITTVETLRLEGEKDEITQKEEKILVISEPSSGVEILVFVDDPEMMSAKLTKGAQVIEIESDESNKELILNELVCQWTE